MALANYSSPYAAPPPLPQPFLPPPQQQQQQPPPAPATATAAPGYANDPYGARRPRYYPAESASAAPQLPGYPARPPTYTKVDAHRAGGKTSLHAVLDYDDELDEYYYDDEEEDAAGELPKVTPIQGPIFLRNGSVPVVPLYSYPVTNNGTLVQIPILWTALSVALGLEIRAELIRGAPCIKRFNQLFCPTAGNSYPIDRIELFIDENKALMKRMYGEFQMNPEYGAMRSERRATKREAAGAGAGGRSGKPAPGVPDKHGPPDPAAEPGESYFSKLRHSRQSFRNNQSDTGRVDVCDSKVEIVTPYWASNSAGKVRAVVNTQHFEQAIHQEVCSSKAQTKRCSGDCGCEQKYKWHRLLAYDPDNDCKGIFMDWFLFPSCCVCRCAPD
ncbi:protein spaetzle 3 isoform X2 [Bacillus rossius redtenbacheri]|uniref:protein spaetzle 3 isoform X2 n=1 Tax=Bacillus rossius redtenbacheri TaxID=93214 RepID=UPI002FDE607F